MSHTVSLESISLDSALKIAQLTLEHGKTSKMAPLAVAVLDVRGTLKAYLASDGSSLLRFEIAHAKAWSVLGMGLGARELERRASKVPLFFNNLQVLSEGKMPTVQGGILIRNDAGQIIGFTADARQEIGARPCEWVDLERLERELAVAV